MRYVITNRTSGRCLGTYEGRNTHEAVESMARHAGYTSYSTMCEVLDWNEEEKLNELDVREEDRPRADLYAHLIGKRVRLVDGVDNYPDVLVNAGETGTVTRYDGDSLWIAMDRHFPELDEWKNELQMWDWEDPNFPLLSQVEVVDNSEPVRSDGHSGADGSPVTIVRES